MGRGKRDIFKSNGIKVPASLQTTPLFLEINGLMRQFRLFALMRKSPTIQLAKYFSLKQQLEEIQARIDGSHISQAEKEYVQKYIDTIPLFDFEELKKLAEAETIKVEEEKIKELQQEEVKKKPKRRHSSRKQRNSKKIKIE